MIAFFFNARTLAFKRYSYVTKLVCKLLCCVLLSYIFNFVFVFLFLVIITVQFKRINYAKPHPATVQHYIFLYVRLK